MNDEIKNQIVNLSDKINLTVANFIIDTKFDCSVSDAVNMLISSHISSLITHLSIVKESLKNENNTVAEKSVDKLILQLINLLKSLGTLEMSH